MKRLGWTRLSDPKSAKTFGHWRHKSGWELRHCGHPTAIWPWMAIDPEAPERATMTHNGKGFQTLALAMEAVEAVLAGQALATNDRCGSGTRRIVFPCDEAAW